MQPRLAIIVPVFNEAAVLPALCQQLDKSMAQQLIVVDGGSDDDSWQWLQSNWHNGANRCALQSGAGRAQQMNTGATHSKADIYLFLHADTTLPDGAIDAVLTAVDDSTRWGRFDLRFDSSKSSMRVIAWFINLRSRLTGVATGDQAIFVEREWFERVGGFDPIPLMEDVALCKKLKRIGDPACLTGKVTTSARRWERNGVIKTVLLMWYLRLAYYLGASPQRLAQRYR